MGSSLGTIILGACALVACKKTPVQKEHRVIDAEAPVDDAGALVDLLRATPALVAVSSRVDNPRDLPDFLVDGRADTAWNGRTGDLVGGYIAFRVPADAVVSHVYVHAGFDRKTETDDLFTANVRIAKLRIFRNRTPMKEVALDPNVRGPQRVDIGQAGGDFKLEVREVVPGTKKAWRELVVSELSVWGTPGKTKLARPAPPLVRVGGLDPTTIAAEEPKPFATVDAACAAFVRDTQVQIDAAKAIGAGRIEGLAECRAGKALEGAHAPFAGVLELEQHTQVPTLYEQSFEGAVLALRTDREVFPTTVRLRGVDSAIYWRTRYELLGITWASAPGGDKLVVQVVERRATDPDGFEPVHSEDVTHHGTICELARGHVACRTISTPLRAKLDDPLGPSPVRTSAAGEVLIDVARAR